MSLWGLGLEQGCSLIPGKEQILKALERFKLWEIFRHPLESLQVLKGIVGVGCVGPPLGSNLRVRERRIFVWGQFSSPGWVSANQMGIFVESPKQRVTWVRSYQYGHDLIKSLKRVQKLRDSGWGMRL